MLHKHGKTPCPRAKWLGNLSLPAELGAERVTTQPETSSLYKILDAQHSRRDVSHVWGFDLCLEGLCAIAHFVTGVVAAGDSVA